MCKIILLILYFVVFMFLFSGIGALISAPSTISNILGIIVFILFLCGTIWFFKQISKDKK